MAASVPKRVDSFESPLTARAGPYMYLDGMMIAIPAPHWALFRELSDKAFADALHEVASSVHLSRYQKHPRGPKKKPPERTAYQNGKHVSTAKLLAQR